MPCCIYFLLATKESRSPEAPLLLRSQLNSAALSLLFVSSVLESKPAPSKATVVPSRSPRWPSSERLFFFLLLEATKSVCLFLFVHFVCLFVFFTGQNCLCTLNGSRGAASFSICSPANREESERRLQPALRPAAAARSEPLRTGPVAGGFSGSERVRERARQ